ncbi:hypothetical protein QFC19_006173 [Naganishia cerealis]|uniref:Uncharacterized protein n=1 Tax=Naganishia cerealis TaxID=610337 RepID=A0ACC2VHS2_9TREE|nr:hypothetical protein QFC19_006173 [Naganishia cerealis]
MAAKQGHNIRSTATKRILQEHREFLADPSPDFVAHPLEEDIFEWHVTVRGVENSEYAGAIVGLMSFWSQGGEALAGVGAMNCDKDERKRLAKLSVDWTCPVCQKSNQDIMQEHEEKLDLRKVEKFEKESLEKEQGAVEPLGDGNEPLPELSTQIAKVEGDDRVDSRDEGEMVARDFPNSLDLVRTASATTTRRPATITLNDHLAEVPSPPPFVTRALLKPPPTYLAPIRLAHYHLCKMFCPVQYREYMPPRPDAILWLDTLISLILTTLVILVMHKLARSWTRIAYMAINALEKVLGIDMSWITNKFSPTTATTNSATSYHWTTPGGGAVAAVAGVNGDRTRMRNIDTAMRARDIARRFGRPPAAVVPGDREAAIGGGGAHHLGVAPNVRPQAQVDAGGVAADLEPHARRAGDL